MFADIPTLFLGSTKRIYEGFASIVRPGYAMVSTRLVGLVQPSKTQKSISPKRSSIPPKKIRAATPTIAASGMKVATLVRSAFKREYAFAAAFVKRALAGMTRTASRFYSRTVRALDFPGTARSLRVFLGRVAKLLKSEWQSAIAQAKSFPQIQISNNVKRGTSSVAAFITTATVSGAAFARKSERRVQDYFRSDGYRAATKRAQDNLGRYWHSITRLSKTIWAVLSLGVTFVFRSISNVSQTIYRSSAEYIRAPETQARNARIRRSSQKLLSVIGTEAMKVAAWLGFAVRTLAKPEIRRPIVLGVCIVAFAIWLDYVLWIYPQLRAEQFLNSGGTDVAARAIELENRTRAINSAILGGLLILGVLAWRLIKGGDVPRPQMMSSKGGQGVFGNVIRIAAVNSLERIAIQNHAASEQNDDASMLDSHKEQPKPLDELIESSAAGDSDLSTSDCPVDEYFGWSRASRLHSNISDG
jgi:hypothetical protein